MRKLWKAITLELVLSMTLPLETASWLWRAPCEPKPCLASLWSKWSSCRVSKCGVIATSERTRYVIQKSDFGGKRCPTLHQMRTCVIACQSLHTDEPDSSRDTTTVRRGQSGETTNSSRSLGRIILLAVASGVGGFFVVLIIVAFFACLNRRKVTDNRRQRDSYRRNDYACNMTAQGRPRCRPEVRPSASTRHPRSTVRNSRGKSGFNSGGRSNSLDVHVLRQEGFLTSGQTQTQQASILAELIDHNKQRRGANFEIIENESYETSTLSTLNTFQPARQQNEASAIHPTH